MKNGRGNRECTLTHAANSIHIVWAESMFLQQVKHGVANKRACLTVQRGGQKVIWIGKVNRLDVARHGDLNKQ